MTDAYRVAPREGDSPWVRQAAAATGFFSPAEVEVAVELVDDWIAKGSRSDYRFLFLESDGMRSGYACYGPIACTISSHDLYWIVVHPDFQRFGLGRKIMAEVESRVRAEGGTRIYADTSGRPQYEPTRSFYERSGFEVAARLTDFYAPGDDKVIYVRKL